MPALWEAVGSLGEETEYAFSRLSRSDEDVVEEGCSPPNLRATRRAAAATASVLVDLSFCYQAVSNRHRWDV